MIPETHTAFASPRLYAKFNKANDYTIPLSADFSTAVATNIGTSGVGHSHQAVDKTVPAKQAKEEKPEMRVFNKRLAYDIQEKLKAKQPDITAAFVTATVYSWLSSRNNRHKVDGQKAAYQSAAGIQKDLPWLSKRAIADALHRLSKAFPKNFTISGDPKKVKNFSISNKFIERYLKGGKGSGAISLRLEDAMRFGVPKALLMNNLEYRCSEKFKDAPRDDQERAYNSISARLLSIPTKDEELNETHPLPILPYSREELSRNISELKADGVFARHPEIDDVYRVDRSAFTDGYANENIDTEVPNIDEKPAICRCDQTAIASDQTAQGVSKLHISVTELRSFPGTDTEDTMKDTMKIESVCIRPNREEPDRSNLISLSKIEDQQPIQPNQNSNRCKSYEDVMPDVLPEVQRQVEAYRSARKAGTLITTVHPDDLTYDVIVDPVRALWEENGLAISPLTDRPVDWGDFEEQLDLAMYELQDSFDFASASKKEIAGFRQLFRDFPDLTIDMVRDMRKHTAFGFADRGDFDDSKKKPGKYEHDNYYWAKRTNSLGSFVKYFKQLFIETHIGFELIGWANGKALRDWVDAAKGVEPHQSICAEMMAKDAENIRLENECQAKKTQAIR